MLSTIVMLMTVAVKVNEVTVIIMMTTLIHASAGTSADDEDFECQELDCWVGMHPALESEASKMSFRAESG